MRGATEVHWALLIAEEGGEGEGESRWGSVEGARSRGGSRVVRMGQVCAQRGEVTRVTTRRGDAGAR